MLPGYCATQFVRLEACQTHHPLRLNDFTEASLDLSTMSSAQRDLLPLDEAQDETEAAAPFALKEQVAQRLAAHRARRNQRPHPSPRRPAASPMIGEPQDQSHRTPPNPAAQDRVRTRPPSSKPAPTTPQKGCPLAGPLSPDTPPPPPPPTPPGSPATP